MLKPTVQIHHVNGILVAEFWDCLRLDPAPIQELRRQYEAHIQGKGRPELVVDLLGVCFAGSAALGHFVAMHKFARQRGGRIIFCNVDPTVFEVFRVSKLDPLFTFVPDREAALERVANPQPAPRPDAPAADGSQAEPPKPSSPDRPAGNRLSPGIRRKKLS